MKKPILFLLLISLCIFGCKDKEEKDKTPIDGTEVSFSDSKNGSKDPDRFEKAKDCDEFIDQYEDWMDKYVAFFEKYKDNPMGAVTSKEYQEMAVEASSWSQQWMSLAISCSNNESYGQRFKKISSRAEKKMEELGFN
ncbi:MAG: DUF6591 domain-containing protein [Bacteroidota bacterium]